jgi:hypothetical protein
MAGAAFVARQRPAHGPNSFAGLATRQTVPAIKNALIELLHASAYRTGRAGAARALALQEFSLASMSERLIPHYRGVRP